MQQWFRVRSSYIPVDLSFCNWNSVGLAKCANAIWVCMHPYTCKGMITEDTTVYKEISTLTLCCVHCSGSYNPFSISICGNKHSNISNMHVNFSLSNQIESLWSKYLFSYSLTVYNMRERQYKQCVANEEFLLTYRPGQHMLDIGNP